MQLLCFFLGMIPKQNCVIFFPKPFLLYGTLQKRLPSQQPPLKASALWLPLLEEHNYRKIKSSRKILSSSVFIFLKNGQDMKIRRLLVGGGRFWKKWANMSWFELCVYCWLTGYLNLIFLLRFLFHTVKMQLVKSRDVCVDLRCFMVHVTASISLPAGVRNMAREML